MSRTRGVEVFEGYFFSDIPDHQEFDDLSGDLDAVFESSSLGFRELLATVVYGKLLDHTYDPSSGLYACNPRSLYEIDMRPVLVARGVPCGQSGPLNIAKATRSLDSQWAAQRRPKAHAEAVLRLVGESMNFEPAKLRVFAAELGRRFSADALAVALSQNDLAPVDSAVRLAAVAKELIERYPLKGESPQRVCGIALETEFRQDALTVVHGVTDSASTTNTTSGKLGDLSVERHGETISIYEVTVKPFSEQRISEALQSIAAHFDGDPPAGLVVQVLCRAQDVPSSCVPSGLGGYLGEHVTAGVVFEFLDIYEWLAIKIASWRLEDRNYFFEQVQAFLNSPRVPIKVRNWWGSAIEE